MPDPFLFGRSLPLDHKGYGPGEDQKDSHQLYDMKLAMKKNHRKDGHWENAGIPYGS